MDIKLRQRTVAVQLKDDLGNIITGQVVTIHIWKRFVAKHLLEPYSRVYVINEIGAW